MMPFSLYLALKYLRPSRSFVSVVTLISIVGVLLGVAILLIVLSIMTGFDGMWREKILSFKPHAIVTSVYGVMEDADSVCERVETIAGVTGVSPGIETRVLAQFQGRTTAPIVIGIDAERGAHVSRIKTNLVAGVFELEGESVVLGEDMAQQLRLGLGDKLLVYSPLNVIRRDELYLPLELTVTGIYNMGMRDFDASFLLTSLDVARELMGMEDGEAHAVFVVTDDPFRFMHYRERLQEVLGDAYRVQTWDEVDAVLFSALRHEKNLMFLLLVFITVVAIFCVTNTLIVITVQKTGEIGLLKALGFSSAKIMGAFVWHGWIQCLVGIVAGHAFGFLILFNLRGIAGLLARVGGVHVFPKEIYGLDEIPWSISTVEVLGISLCVLGFCTLASFLPAYRASRLNPAEALRHE